MDRSGEQLPPCLCGPIGQNRSYCPAPFLNGGGAFLLMTIYAFVWDYRFAAIGPLRMRARFLVVDHYLCGRQVQTAFNLN